MKMNKRIMMYTLWIVLGAVLVCLGWKESVDQFWSGMGVALITVSVMRLLQSYRLHKDESYREKVELEVKDERNRFLRGRAWAWAGYLFILIMSVMVIALKVMGQDLLCKAAGAVVCLMLILYWGSYLILQKKY